MRAQFLQIFLISVALILLGVSAATPPKVYELKEIDSVEEDVANVAEFDLIFGVDCNIPSLEDLESMLRHHFELGVILYDADRDEEIDVVVNIHESSKISGVVSYLQNEEGLSCEMSISETIFISSQLVPDSNEFMADLYESGFMEDVNHEPTEQERRNLASYPETVDLRQYSTGVKEQIVGSCGAHTAATVKEIQERKDYGLTDKLSTRFVYAYRGGGEGMNMHHVFTILRDVGIPLEKHYPTYNYWTSGKYDKVRDIPAEAKRFAKFHRVSTLKSFQPRSMGSVNDVKDRLKTLINEMGAGAIGVLGFEKKPGNDECNVYKYEDGEKWLGLHMMAVVGYNKNGVIIRNSWGTDWCQGGDLYMSWNDVHQYALEFNFWNDVPTGSCRNFEASTGKKCWNLGGRSLNQDAFCQGDECSLVDAPQCCVYKKVTCLNSNSCCAWGTTCYGCPDNGKSRFEWAWNCGTSRRCNGGSKNICRKNPGDCCVYGSDCHGCPWGNEHVWPNVCGSSRRCKLN